MLREGQSADSLHDSKAVRKGIHIIRSVIGSFGFQPLILVVSRKEGITREGVMDQSQIHAIRQGQGLLVKRGPADNHDFMAGLYFIHGLFYGMRHDTVLRFKTGIAGNNDIDPSRQRLAKGFKGLAPHHHRFAHGQTFEVFEVGRQIPGQSVALADDTVLRHGGNNGNNHREDSSRERRYFALYGNGGLDGGMCLIIHQLEIIIVKIEYRFDVRIEAHLRRLVWGAL